MKAPASPKASSRPYPRATYLIKELERAVRLRIDALAEPLGLTAVQYTALSVLSGHPGMSATQLARRSFVSPQAANEMVTVLERRGLLRRRAGAEGGRALWIHLTPTGERTLAGCDEQVDELEAQLFAGVTRRDETLFRAMLRSCRENVREQPVAPTGRAGRA
jgi:DNA-binding MarR family transcriptional regulator